MITSKVGSPVTGEDFFDRVRKVNVSELGLELGEGDPCCASSG